MPYYHSKEKSKQNHFRDDNHLSKVRAPVLTELGLSQPQLCFDISEPLFSTNGVFFANYYFKSWSF